MTEQNEIVDDPQAGLKAVDDLLTELDPEFKQKLAIMNSEVEQSGLTEALESISLSADYLKQDQNAPRVEEIKAPVHEDKFEEIKVKSAHTLAGFILLAFWQTALFVAKCLPKLGRFVISIRKTNVVPEFKKFVEATTPLAKNLVPVFQEILNKIKGYKTGAYIKFGVVVVLIVVMKMTFSDMKKHLTPDGEKDPFLRSWAEAADSVGESPSSDSDADIENPQRHPEYTVLIHRIVANLKPPSPKASPMIAAELYIEASNQDCAIEIHDREQEVRDALTRVFEESTFNELDSKDGKERLKAHIRGSLNHFLTKGHVKRVFFSAFNISL